MQDAKRFRWKRISGLNSSEPIRPKFGARVVLVGHLIFLLQRGEKWRFADVLNLKTKSWSPLPSCPLRLSLHLHTAVLWEDKIILLGLGRVLKRVGYMTCPEAFAVDVVTKEVDVMPTYGDNPGYLFQNTSNLYEQANQLVLFGGTTGHVGERSNALNILELRTKVWKHANAKGQQPPGLIRHGACIANHMLFVFAGSQMNGGNDSIYLIRLDRKYYIWQRLQPPGFELHRWQNPACFSLGNDRILVFGGYTHRRVNDLHILENVSSQTPQWQRVIPGKDLGLVGRSEYRWDGDTPERIEAPCVVHSLDKIVLLEEENSYCELTAQD